jgi:ankyrin repeat protein
MVYAATLRNSYQCLALLIEYGGLDPNMPINSHGSTAAHFAAWKDHVECLQVLQCGTYIDESNEEINFQGTTHGENEDAEKDPDVPHRGAFYALLTASSGKAKWWSAHWNKQNSLGETPIHVAAKEGCKKSMHFFLDLAITAATSSLNEEGNDTEAVIDFSMRDNDGMDCAAVAAKYDQAYIITLFSRSIKRLLDLSVDVHNDLPLPISTQGGLWHGSLALATMASPQRRRTSSEPDNFYSNKEVLSPIRKLPQAPQRSNYHQQCLPHFFPTFNLRNSLEEHNHEMPIHVAARYGNCAAIEALFKSDNCEITSLDSLGQNAVHVAALQGRIDACQLLIHLANDQFKKFDVADNLGR